MTHISLHLWSEFLGHKKLLVPIYWKASRSATTDKLPSYNPLVCAGHQPQGLNQEKVTHLRNQILLCDDLLILLRGLCKEGGSKGSSAHVMTYAQRKASSWALEITTQCISRCVGKQVCFQPLRVSREHQHQTTCAWGSGQDPCMKPTGQGCWVLNPHCIFWVSLGLWWGAEF